MQLDQELRNITQGNSTINAYCTRIKNLVGLLENIDVVVPEKNLVNYVINGMNPRFDHIASSLRHRTPSLTLLETRSILALEEQTMNQIQNRSSTSTH